MLTALDNDLVAILESQGESTRVLDTVFTCRAETIEDAELAIVEGVDDLIIDPTRWPTATGGLKGPSLERLAMAWHTARSRPRVVVYVHRSPANERKVRQLLAMLPASWRDAPLEDPLALAPSKPTTDVDGRPSSQRMDALLREATMSPALWSPKRIAARLGCSEKTVNRQLAASNRPSLASMLRAARLALAHELVRARAGTVHEIASQCGWSDVRALRRALCQGRSDAPTADNLAVHDWRLPADVRG